MHEKRLDFGNLILLGIQNQINRLQWTVASSASEMVWNIFPSRALRHCSSRKSNVTNHLNKISQKKTRNFPSWKKKTHIFLRPKDPKNSPSLFLIFWLASNLERHLPWDSQGNTKALDFSRWMVTAHPLTSPNFGKLREMSAVSFFQQKSSTFLRWIIPWYTPIQPWFFIGWGLGL